MTDHVHDWVLNFDWDGGPSPYPIAQCIVCNWTDIEAARAALAATPAPEADRE